MAYENFGKLIKYFRSLQEADLFPIVAVSGALGQGKTSFSMQCSIKYCKEYLNESYFSCNKYIAYDNDEVLAKYYNLPENSPLIADEAVRFAMSMDWNKAINKEVKRKTTEIRPRHLLFFMNIPNFSWMDAIYRHELVSMWAWIPTRGYAVIFRPDNNPGEKDRWHLKEFTKYRHRIDHFTDIDKIYSMVNSHKCFFDMVQFPKVPEDIYQEYLKIRLKRTIGDAAESYILQKDIAKIMSWNLKNRWNELHETIHRSRKKVLSYRIMADVLLKDPVNNIHLAKYSSIRNWVAEVQRKLPEQVKPPQAPEQPIQSITDLPEVEPEDDEKKQEEV